MLCYSSPRMTVKGLTALRNVSGLSVDVSDLVRNPGTSKALSFTEEIVGLGLDVGKVRPAMAFELLLESLIEGVLVTGEIKGAYSLECIRCVRDFERPFAISVSEVLVYEGQTPADDGYQVSSGIAPLEPVVRDAVLLSMPVHPLCRPDCRGLCVACGADRNTTDCGHREERVDLRWQPLQSLKEKMGD